MAVEAMGPTYAGGTQPVVQGGYSVLYLPDVNNRELQAQGEAPVFYYIPNEVRIAHEGGPEGRILFNLTRFAGTGGGVIGGGGDVAGGVLTFSVTGALPDDVRTQAEAEITARFQGSGDVFWGIRGPKPPMFRPAIITASTTSVSNISPTPRGFPTLVEVHTRGARPVTAIKTFGMPASRRTRDGGPPPGVDGGAPAPAPTGGAAPDPSAGNLDPWYWEMQGQGAGSIDPTGTHAFSGLIGSYPAAICWEAFHGTASPLIVIQNYKLKVWSPVVTLSIVGHWQDVVDHLSTAASGHYLWASADIKAEFNNMRKSGTIKVDLKVDQTLPGAEEIAKKLDEKSDLVYEKFMEMAKNVIFDVPAPHVEPAQASSSGGLFSPWGAGLALKYRHDETTLDLTFEQTEQFAYLQDHTISSSLAGMFDEMHKDPDAEHKYFLNVSLDDWPVRLARIFRPVLPGDGTVAFVSAECAYVDAKGNKLWQGQSFTGDPGEDGTWKYQTAQKRLEDVTNPPAGWKPDLTFVKRKVHLNEPPSETENSYQRVQIEANEIALDPEPDGRLLNDTTIEVRADSAGRLAVGPIQLGVVLTDNTQTVEAVFEAVDPDTGASAGLGPVRFVWNYGDYERDRSWLVFTGDPKLQSAYQYQVTVTKKGDIFSQGQSWQGPWTRASGNGPLVVQVPRPDSPGVVTRALPDPRYAHGATLAAQQRTVRRPARAIHRAARSAPPAPRSGPTYLDYQL